MPRFDYTERINPRLLKEEILAAGVIAPGYDFAVGVQDSITYVRTDDPAVQQAAIDPIVAAHNPAGTSQGELDDAEFQDALNEFQARLGDLRQIYAVARANYAALSVAERTNTLAVFGDGWDAASNAIKLEALRNVLSLVIAGQGRFYQRRD